MGILREPDAMTMPRSDAVPPLGERIGRPNDDAKNL